MERKTIPVIITCLSKDDQKKKCPAKYKVNIGKIMCSVPLLYWQRQKVTFDIWWLNALCCLWPWERQTRRTHLRIVHLGALEFPTFSRVNNSPTDTKGVCNNCQVAGIQTNPAGVHPVQNWTFSCCWLVYTLFDLCFPCQTGFNSNVIIFSVYSSCFTSFPSAVLQKFMSTTASFGFVNGNFCI